MKPLVERPDEWMETAPVRIRAERVLDATPAQVWERIADHETWPEWLDAVSAVEVTGARDAVGGGRRVKAGPILMEEKFTRWDPEHAFGFTITAMSRRLVKSMNERVTLEPVGSGTRVVYEQAIDPSAVMGLLLKAVQGRVAAQLGAGLDRLGALLPDF